MRPIAAWLVTLALAGCTGAPAQEPAALELGLPRAAQLALPPDWRTCLPAAFESWVLSALPEERVTPIAKAGMDELQRALEEPDSLVAVRAAVILGRSRYPSCASPLIRRLERRVLGTQRWSDAVDTLAAAALARYPDPRRYAQRLVPLAASSRPHPDLEVRVECAATALHAGFAEVVPFLLQVLRIDTWAGQSDQRDFAVSPTTAWARGRAAEALSSYAGVPLTYRPDGSIAHREAEAARLAALLLPAARSAENASSR